MHLRHLLFLLTAAGITACGSEKPIYPELELAPTSAAGLAPAEGEALAEHLKNGMRLQLRENSRPSGGGWIGWGGGGSSAPPAPTPAPTPTPGGFSGTNVHVAGIDEADIVKYDGEHWFIAARAGTEDFQHHPNSQLLVARLDPAAPGAEMIAQHSFRDDFGSAEMYLTGEDDARQLAMLRQKRGNVVPQAPAWGGGFAFTRAYPDNGQLRLSLVDVGDPAKPTETRSITIDGTVIDSRRIGDTLYLMTRFDPWLEALVYDAGASHLREANEAALVAAPLTALLPHVDEGAGERLLTETCLLPADRKPHHGFAPMVFVSTIDLAAGKLQSSTCISAQVSSLSMFSESLYVTGQTPAGNTVLHKFKVDEAGLEYIAAGEVAGSVVNGISDPAFRLDERDGYLRVVSSHSGGASGTGNAPPPVPRTPVHKLTVLEQQGERLVTVAELPNEARPEAIGKPFENIYSVRFEEDTAYLVTFQRTDPLYAIDLSDPLDPRIAGELEIPGYATYMHPLAGDYLFTLGMSANQSGVVDGMKFELVKVEDGQPRVVDSILMPEAYGSEALDNLRALSVLQVSEQQYRFALPVLLRPGEQDYYSQAEHALQLLEVNLGEEAIIDGGRISGGMDQGSAQRGLLQDDAVFYASGRQVMAAPFAAPESAIAAGDPPSEVICGPAESRPSFVLELALGDDAPFASCPSLDMLHRRGVSREALALEGELEDGECRYEGPMLRAGLYTTQLEQPGYYGELLALAVYAEACDIVPVAERVVLRPLPAPVPCDLEPRPSISLLVALDDGEGDACAAAVTVFNIGTRAQHRLTGEPAEGGCRFDGPYEQAGSFQVTVAAAGYQSQTLSTYVPRLVCSVETRELTVALEADSAD